MVIAILMSTTAFADDYYNLQLHVVRVYETKTGDTMHGHELEGYIQDGHKRRDIHAVCERPLFAGRWYPARYSDEHVLTIKSRKLGSDDWVTSTCKF
jgi:hypothetical protein